jgi:hypothetical protein
MKNALIIDPAMGRIPGHWTNYNKLLSVQLASQNLKPTVFSNKQTLEKITVDLNLVRCFDNDPYIPWVIFGDLHQTLKNLEKYGKLYSQNIADAQKNLDRNEGLLLICPTITPPILHGVFDYLEDQKNVQIKCKIIFQFSDGLSLEYYDQHENIFGIGYQHVIREFSSLLEKNKQIKFFASTPEFAYVLNLLLNIPISALPMIQGEKHPSWNRELIPDLSIKKELSIGLFGHSSKAKGSDFIYKLLLEKLTADSSLNLILHYNPNTDEEPPEINAIASLPNVKFTRGFVKKNKLINLMKECDIILLPYEPHNYLFMMSAIFIEALLLRKVTIVPKDTVMWKIVDSFNCGSGFSNLKCELVSEALDSALENYSKLCKSVDIAAQYIENQGAEKYVEQLLDV